MHAAGRMSRNQSPSEVRKSTPDDKANTIVNSQGAHEQDESRAPELNPTSTPNIPETQIQTALARALNSAEFQTAPQLRSFLAFVVQATLTHRPEKLKGYLIAVEALGRSKDFNPVLDPIVRVEAARLRRRLARYYKGSGSSEPVRISIPKGSYAPEFAYAAHGPHDGQRVENQENTQSKIYKLRDGTGATEHARQAHNFSVQQEACSNDHAPDGAPRSTRDQSVVANLAGQVSALLQYPVPFFAAVTFSIACFVAGYLSGSP